jgi:hypothetical protein
MSDAMALRQSMPPASWLRVYGTGSYLLPAAQWDVRECVWRDALPASQVWWCTLLQPEAGCWQGIAGIHSVILLPRLCMVAPAAGVLPCCGACATGLERMSYRDTNVAQHNDAQPSHVGAGWHHQ